MYNTWDVDDGTSFPDIGSWPLGKLLCTGRPAEPERPGIEICMAWLLFQQVWSIGKWHDSHNFQEAAIEIIFCWAHEWKLSAEGPCPTRKKSHERAFGCDSKGCHFCCTFKIRFVWHATNPLGICKMYGKGSWDLPWSPWVLVQWLATWQLSDFHWRFFGCYVDV